MKIGDVIRSRRKNLGITQEEMANRLGVTAPAVNKWERGNALPDVALLAPIARLLKITTDELLSFRDELTEGEVSQYLLQVQADLESKNYHEVFLAVKKKIGEYPNCENLIWQAAVILDAKRETAELLNREDYDRTIIGWYERCLLSSNEQIRRQAADLLFHLYYRKEDYEKASQYWVNAKLCGYIFLIPNQEIKEQPNCFPIPFEKYGFGTATWIINVSEIFLLDGINVYYGKHPTKFCIEPQYLEFFSPDNPERKRKEALVNSKTGKRTEAYRAYEELIFTAYQHIQSTLNDLRLLYMADDDHEMAKKLVNLSSSVASAFEMGRYNEVCPGLDVAVWEKNTAWTAQLMQDMIENIETIGDFTKSKLYQHMVLKEAASDFTDTMRLELLKSLEDESFSYMQGNENWEMLKNNYF